MDESMNDNKAAGAPYELNAGLERDQARAAFYKGADRGEPMHWRDMGPDEVWNAAWDAGAAAEREACAKECEEQAGEPECPERARYCAESIRERSNAEVRGCATEKGKSDERTL